MKGDRKMLDENSLKLTNNIAYYRKRAGLTQEGVAERLGIVRQSYNKLEANPARIKVGTLESLAKIFDCNIKDFFKDWAITESNNL